MASEANRAHNPWFRPLEFTEILDHSLRVFRGGWKPLLLLGLISAAPSIVTAGIQQALLRVDASNPTANIYFRLAFGLSQSNYSELWKLGGIFLTLWAVTMLLFPLLHGAVIAACARMYLGQPTDVAMAFRIALRRYPALLGTYLLEVLFYMGAVIGLALGGLVVLAFLTVPVGLIALGVYTVFTAYAVLIEGAPGGWAPIRRSFVLVSGRFWPLLGLGLICSLFFGVLAGQLSTVSSLPVQLVQTFYFKLHPSLTLTWVVAVLSGLVSAVLTPIQVMALTLAYYDTRMRKEAFDLELLAAGRQAGE